MKSSGILNWLSNLLTAPKDHDPHAYWIYARCNRCGEKISARVNLNNDLSLDYAAEEKGTGYYCRKVLMGNQLCFQQIEVHLKFSEKRELLDRQIYGGTFISGDEISE